MDDDLGIDGVDPSVSFLYKTMFSRDPKKRRVKPVQKHLIQVDFGGLDDSEEDSDFELNSHKEGHNSDSGEEESDKGSKESSESKEVASEAENAEEGDEEEAAAEGEAESSEGDNDDDDNGDDDDSNDESNDESSSDNDEDADSSREEPAFNFFGDYDEDEDEDYVPKKKDKQKKAAVDTVVKLKLPEAKLPPVSETQLKVNHGHIKVLICCVCLSDTNADDDEIVECDNCGVSVHEGCYGISESQSAASTESSASTEPWFCDACKAGVKPHCELCPNFGGIYKETDAGKWVHLVCALYTPGVAFGDVDKLSPVTLFEMPYVRWGARECALCEDARFCRTGVCISCDAGMCRTYFHVTCAQREGLLSEASPEEVMDIADPFFAYCKLHADKNSARAKRRNWLAIQSHVRRHSDRVLEDEKEKARFHRKLNRHRQKYAIAKSRRPPSWVPTQKLVRFLTSSPSAVRRMLKKAELMGVITQVHNSSHGHEKQETRKKLHIAPALTSDFIGYYLERNARIENLKQNMKDLITQNDKLKDQEKILRSQYDQLFAALEKHKESTTRLRKEGEKMWDNLSESGGKVTMKVNIPEMFRPKKAPRSPTKKETPKSPPAVIHKCGICVLTTDQHLLAKCDSCKKHYHLGCLDPPLTRMPKKTKLQGWQCSECVSSSSDESVEKSNVNVDAPRRLRETIKQPQKFVNMQRLEMLKYSLQKEKRNKSKNAKRSSSSSSSSRRKKTVEQEKQEEEVESVPTPTPAPDPDPEPEPEPELDLDLEEPEPESEQEPVLEPPPKKPKMTPTTSAPKKPKPTKEDEQRNVCVVCNQPGSNSNLVSCDECQLCYHFQCLNPPTRKSPKPRGYTWHCEACDPTDESEMDDDDEDEGTVEGEVHTRPSSPEEVMEHVEIVNLGDEDADVDVEEEDDVVQIDDSD
ncbi:PHD finger protein 14-like isoform X6 [Haliotis rubra]|uniref:PHD finger protein 14-like isoform X6 n=1 Tax=Haliotis rubra TaxID=36100 RepID=UPI001EE5ECFB|nr:PHD finger protein 14-like isoform X6 [Haliotis rubra]